MNAMKTLLLISSAALFAACSSTPKPTAAPVEAAAPAPVAAPAPAAPAPVAAPQAPAVALPAHLDPNSPISTQRSVFFDFDTANIKAEYNSVIELQGKYLSSNPALAVRVEGNTDERGSTEYNLALGQRRAESVVKALKVVGVKDKQVEAVSFGEEKPKAAGHDEAAWAQNRRADVVYPQK
jgi:peptidoglycan-associated lipoprotein